MTSFWSLFVKFEQIALAQQQQLSKVLHMLKKKDTEQVLHVIVQYVVFIVNFGKNCGH